MGHVGSVLLFGDRPPDHMRDIAFPTDSSTSKRLLRWYLEKQGLDPRTIDLGPDLGSMLQQCDGALLIGDRALRAASEHPSLVQLDLGAEWRFYGSEDSKFSDPTRCGLPTNELLPQSSLGSTISFKMGESWDMRKIRNYHQWNAMPYKERSLYNVFDSIQVRAINSGLPACIIEEAKILYKQIEHAQVYL